MAKRLTAQEQVKREWEIVRMKARGRSVAAVAEHFGVNPSTVTRAWAKWREHRVPDLRGRDPSELVWESIERYEEWIEQLAEIAFSADQDTAKVGAVNAQAKLQAQRDDLLQKSGILPQNLGKLKIEHDVRYLSQVIVQVLREDKVPLATQRKILEALRPGGEPTDN